MGDSWMPALASTMLDRVSPMKSEDTTSSWQTLQSPSSNIQLCTILAWRTASRGCHPNISCRTCWIEVKQTLAFNGLLMLLRHGVKGVYALLSV